MAISITSRVRNAMVCLTLGLCLLFTALIFLLVYVIEDQVFVNQVNIEQAMFKQIIEDADPQLIRDWQPINRNIQRIDSLNNLPTSLPATALSGLAERLGVHEYFDDDNAMFIASLMMPSNAGRVYLVYDVTDLLVVRNTKRTLFYLIGGLTLFIALVAVLLARQLTKSTLAPVSRLSHALQNNDLDHVVIELANEFSEDEIGVLAHELAQALEQVRKSAEREYQFNRGVSHELRSPMQVAQSATELLHLVAGDGDTKLSKPIARLQRSIAEMNEIAEAFLWLASDRVVEQSEMCSTATLQKTLAVLQSGFPGHEIIINTTSLAPRYYPLPSTALSVVLRSLIRNAVVHGDPPKIMVDMHADRITVSNSVNLVTHENKGFGIGLSIVQRICDRFGCELNSSLQNDNRYNSSVVFNSFEETRT
jgi:signal transduction histidine kinase